MGVQKEYFRILGHPIEPTTRHKMRQANRQESPSFREKSTLLRQILSSALPELWFSSSGGVCVCVRVCREPLYL